MRTSLFNKAFFSADDSPGQPWGVNIGLDHVAEHEWGIGKLERALGLERAANPRAIGVNSRRIQNTAKVVIVEGTFPAKKATKRTPSKPSAPFLCAMFNPCMYVPENVPPSGVKLNRKQSDAFLEAHKIAEVHTTDRAMYAAWDDGEAIVCVSGESAISRLNHVLKGLEEVEGLAISLAQASAFGLGGGLYISRLSAVPADLKQTVVESDTQYWKLMDAVEATGIKDKLKAAGLKYYALSPDFRWDREGELRFFLNPQSQTQNHSGWMSLEDLEVWAAGQGVIPTRGAQQGLAEQERDVLEGLACKLSGFYGNPLTQLITWADAAKTVRGMRVSVGPEGVAAGIKDGGVYTAAEMEVFIAAAEERALQKLEEQKLELVMNESRKWNAGP